MTLFVYITVRSKTACKYFVPSSNYSVILKINETPDPRICARVCQYFEGTLIVIRSWVDRDPVRVKCLAQNQELVEYKASQCTNNFLSSSQRVLSFFL